MNTSGEGKMTENDAYLEISKLEFSYGEVKVLHGLEFELPAKSIGCVMASDAFFPFPDCVEIAKKAGVTSVIQPGGSIKDNLSIDYCNENNLSMVMSGIRHFKH